MSLIFRNYISMQRIICLQKFASQGRPIAPSLCNIGNIKKLTGTLQVKYVHTKNNDETDEVHIYSGKSKVNLRNVKILSLTTTCATAAIQPSIYIKCMELDHPEVSLGLMCFISLYTMCTPLLIHYIIGKKYVIDMYYNPEKNKYTAEMYNVLLKRRKVEFSEDDVDVPDVTGPFTTCYVKGKPLFFNEPGFSDLVYYHKIMGNYKPIDFHLSHDVEKIRTLPNDQGKQN
ncbi:transmembrane protein 70 homolog, mitochondrial [Lasioglossum baleicum]|uniref:transmembrane protein 70 homolog, mitochondrial n=1 Tax=Lasioglossum baleicum TaxID=434251 RepID=UPI003FCE909C